MPGRKPTKKTRTKKGKKNLTAKVKAAAIRGLKSNPQYIIGKTAYKEYQKLTPAQKAAVNKALISAAIALL